MTGGGYVEAPLFDPAPYRMPDADQPLSAGRRRTLLQRRRLAVGVHPLSGVARRVIHLHPDAPPVADRAAEGPRCGSCWFRQILPYHARSFPKCVHPGTYSAEDVAKLGYPRVSHSEASDCRAWWPACVDYSPGDGRLSPDAARHTPGGGAE